MSGLNLALKGMELVEAKNYPEAINLLSKAIDQSKSPQWLLSRSKAFMETGDFDRALLDAEYAYCTAVERGNDKSRKQMIEAQHRRSVVYFRQKLYANADICATWAQELAKGTAVKIADHSEQLVDHNGFYHATSADIDPHADPKGKNKASDSSTFAKVSSLMGPADTKKHPYEKDYQREKFWRENTMRWLEALPADDPARKITVKMVPNKPDLDDRYARKSKEHDAELEAAQVVAKAVTKSHPSNGTFRSDFYQQDSSCTVALFMKFASKEDTEKVQVDIQPNLITITGVPREPSTVYIVPHATVDPAKSSYRVVSMKVELYLAKAQLGKWSVFGHEVLTKPEPSILSTETSDSSTRTAAAFVPSGIFNNTNPTVDKPPAYPTSSKSGPKDWDRMAGDDDDDAQLKDTDAFFKELYAGAGPEAQRAMIKSYQESNGTTLSTNWDEVSKGPVETRPPKGMTAKKWYS